MLNLGTTSLPVSLLHKEGGQEGSHRTHFSFLLIALVLCHLCLLAAPTSIAFCALLQVCEGMHSSTDAVL